MRIHSEKLSRKKSSLIATGTGTDFHDNVLVIIRILRKEKNLNLLFKFCNFSLGRGKFLLKHITHLFIILFIEHFKAVGNILISLLVLCICLYKRRQIALLFHKFPETVLVRCYIRTCKFGIQILVFN